MAKGKLRKNKAREERIGMEIIADAYGPEEQSMGWYYYLEEKLQFPFTAKILADLRDRVGTEVAHLIYARLLVSSETKGWRFVEIAQASEDVVGRFLRAVPAERLAPIWAPKGEEKEKAKWAVGFLALKGFLNSFRS